MKALTKAALEWAADGIPVFPCNFNKRPMTQNGFYDASTDPEAVRRMFDLAGDCLIGARMGADSGLFACDFDIYKPGEAGEAAQQYMTALMAKGALPETQRHRTMNGGLHLIYYSETAFPNCKPSDGVEIKGEGGYIILPPSRGYSVEADIGFAKAPQALIELLLQSRKQHTDKTISDHEASIIAGKDFHDSLASITARMFRQGASAANVSKRLLDALSASVASAPAHPRHNRWKELFQDANGELSRIITSGREKYDQTAKTEAAKEAVTKDILARVKKAAQNAGFAPTPNERHEDSESFSNDKNVFPDDYGDQWPFANEGYFAHDNLDIANQRFNLYPIYAENESVIIAADPKSGKTAISLKLAIQLAAGRSLGPFVVTDPRAVLYYALEGTRAIKLRLEAEKRAQAKANTPLPDNLPLFVVERSANFVAETNKNAAKVAAAAKYFEREFNIPLGLVVIDTLTKAMPGADQNSVDDTSKLFHFTSQLRDYGVNATVVYVHHTGKDGKTRGSSNIEAEVDVVLKMHKQEDGSTLMRVHMARSIDDNNMYRFQLDSYSLGKTEQGIEQAAPVVTLSEGNVANNATTEDMLRAQKLVPYLKSLVGLGEGVYNLTKLFQHWRDLGLFSGRSRRKAVIDILALMFDRENAVAYAGHIIEAKKNDDGFEAVIVKQPGTS